MIKHIPTVNSVSTLDYTNNSGMLNWVANNIGFIWEKS